MCHALFDLLSRQEYLQPLREEVEEAIQREGWTKSAIDQMSKLDSFIKESQRLHPIGFCQSLISLPQIYRLTAMNYSSSTARSHQRLYLLRRPTNSSWYNTRCSSMPYPFRSIRIRKPSRIRRLPIPQNERGCDTRW
jgi:hypothetical protein